MICYLDTSALVKLYAREPGSETVRELVDESSVVATAKVAYPEARAVLAGGFREEFLGKKDYRQVVTAMQNDWPRYLVLEASNSLVWLAGGLAERHRLRGFYSIHLAAALTLKTHAKDRVVACCFDARLWEAMCAVNLEVAPETAPSRL